MKSYLTKASAGAVLIFLALFAGIFSLISCFSLTVDRELLFLLCAAASLGASALLSAPGARSSGWLSLLVLAATLFYLWQNFPAILQGAQVVFHQISLGYHQELPAILYYELPPLLDAASLPYLTAVSTRFVAVCLPPAALWLGVWILQSGVVWPALVGALLLPGLGLFILREPPPSCLAALLLFLALVLLARRGFRQNALLGSRRMWQAAVPLALVMALLALVFPPEDYQRWDWVETQRLHLLSLQSGLSGPGSATGGPVISGAQSFRHAGPLRFDGHTVLTVQSHNYTGKLFLRGFSAAHYTRSGWQSLTDQEAPLLSSRPWRYPADAHTQAIGSLPSTQVSITDLASQSEYYYVPYFPTSLPEGAQYRLDSYARRPDGTDRYTVSFLPPEDLSPIATLDPARSPWRDTLQDTSGELDYREQVYSLYTNVPWPLLSGDAEQLIRDYADAHPVSETSRSSREDMTAAAEEAADYLASFTRYDQGTSATPANQDFVSRFLTVTHRGYCMHYASAATLILRAMGIPARYVGGYVANVNTPDTVVEVPDKNAHAWVEVYVNGFGWQPVDVTPGFSGSAANLQPTPTPTPTATPTPTTTPTPTPSPTPPPTPRPPASTPPQTTPKGPQLPWGKILGWTFGIFSFLAFFNLQRRYRLKKLRQRCTQADPNQAVLALYRYLRSMEGLMDYAVPQNALDLAQKAAFSQHILTEEERQAMEALARAAARQARRQNPVKRFLLRYFYAKL